MKKITCLSLLFVFIQGCSPSADESYEAGYDDGYTEGYNTMCEISAPFAKGDWNDKNYSHGYNIGQADGAAKGASAARTETCKVGGARY